jgi:hypothetical protein
MMSPRSRRNSGLFRWRGRSQCVVASLVAFAEMVLRLNGVIDAPYYALFLVEPVANFVDAAIGSRSGHSS